MKRDINHIRLSIYEACENGDITEKEKEVLMFKLERAEHDLYIAEASSANIIKNIAYGLAIITAAILAIKALKSIISAIKQYKKCRDNIKANATLSDIDKRLDVCMSKLLNYKSTMYSLSTESNIKKHEYDEMAAKYGNPVTNEDNVSYASGEDGVTAIKDGTQHTVANKDYNPRKAKDAEKEAENWANIEKTCDEQIDLAREVIMEVRSIKSQLLSVAKNLDPDEEELAGVIKNLEKVEVKTTNVIDA